MFWKETDQKILVSPGLRVLLYCWLPFLFFQKKKKKNSSISPFVHVKAPHREHFLKQPQQSHVSHASRPAILLS